MPCMPKNCLLRQSYVIALADISYVYQISDQNNFEIFPYRRYSLIPYLNKIPTWFWV